MNARSVWPTAVVYPYSEHPGGFGTQANPTKTWFIPPAGYTRYIGMLNPLSPLHDVYAGLGGVAPRPMLGPMDGITEMYGMLESARLPKVEG